MGFNRIYPLVNVYITMENHLLAGSINYFYGYFQVRKLVQRLPGRVDPRMSHQALSHRNLPQDSLDVASDMILEKSDAPKL